LYDWWVFIHIVGVVGFVLSHGTSAGMSLRLRHERNPDRIRVLLQISSSSLGIFYISTVLLLVGGIAAGIQGHWFDSGWIWAALATFVVTMVLMYVIASPYYRRIRKVMTIEETGSSAVGPGEIEAVLASPRPMLLTVVGSAALLFIIYLMVLKPF
jgi:uncharacterized membrane protein